MSNIPADLKYASSHEWARLEDDGSIVVGITDHAQEALGDLVYVELPEEGADVSAGDGCAVVESVKAASDVYSPIGGKVLAVNEQLADAPELVNEQPYENGWLMRVDPSNPQDLDNLMDAESYEASLAE